jgi:hypothetical protein
LEELLPYSLADDDDGIESIVRGKGDAEVSGHFGVETLCGIDCCCCCCKL